MLSSVGARPTNFHSANMTNPARTKKQVGVTQGNKTHTLERYDWRNAKRTASANAKLAGSCVDTCNPCATSNNAPSNNFAPIENSAVVQESAFTRGSSGHFHHNPNATLARDNPATSEHDAVVTLASGSSYSRIRRILSDDHADADNNRKRARKDVQGTPRRSSDRGPSSYSGRRRLVLDKDYSKRVINAHIGAQSRRDDASRSLAEL